MASKRVPQYRFYVDAPVNGHVGKPLIKVVDDAGAVVCTDKADLAQQKELEKAADRIAAQLERKPACVRAALRRAWLKVASQAHQRQQAAAAGGPVPAPCSPRSPGPEYAAEGNQTFRLLRGGGSELLANFVARIVGEDVLDDGSGELRRTFRLEGALHDGTPDGTPLPPVSVPAADFAAMNWVLQLWGCRPSLSAGVGAKDRFRAAVQQLSPRPQLRLIYKHLGYRKIDGKWYFLHACGGIGADGANHGVLVQLDGPLARYRLPDPPEGAALVEAVRADIALLDDRQLAPPRVMFPLIGAAYRAPLGRVDASVSLTGPTGVGKSELAALVQQHYGAEMDRLALPGAWASTVNQLGELAFLAKDCVLVIDDFKPGGSKYDVDRHHEKADRVFRAQGNGAGRGRCRSDGSLATARQPRCLTVSTGEDSPRGESCQARNLPLPVNKGDVRITALTPHQQAAARGLLAKSMSGYLRWVAADYDAIQSRLPAERAALRDRALAELTSAHARVPGAVADLVLGLRHFFDFARQAGAIDEARHDALERQAWSALLEAARQQAAAVAGQDPARLFLRLLSSAITSGRAHLAGRSGGEPAKPASCGWRQHTVSSGQYARIEWRPEGRQVGWAGVKGIFLDPDAAYAEAQRLGDDQGERLPLSQVQLYKRLKDGGHLASFEKGKTAKRVTLQGRTRFVLHLRPGVL
jgi:hypothetical protein